MARRPTYETEADLERERQIAERLARSWKADAHKLPKSYGVDFAMLRSKVVVAWVEVKTRRNPSSVFPDYRLSLHKWARGSRLADVTRAPFLLVVAFSDVVLWYSRTGEESRVEVHGRVDRGDPADVEPMIVLPIDQFRRLDHE